MHPLDRYLRAELLPTAFCPGCGNGIVAGAILRAIAGHGYKDLNKFVFVSGIGCAAWIPSPYFKADSIHVAHGRAIPVATGVKLYRPELNVVVIGGDGDIAGIGGNHLIHAARRNVDLLVIMVNNMVYGMTGGQLAPTTPRGLPTSTTPYGNPEHPLDTCAVVAAAGANYVARWSIAHYRQLESSIYKALGIKGFRFIEAVSQCPARVGGRMRMEPYQFIRWLLRNSVPISRAASMKPEELEGRIVVGEYVSRERETLLEALGRVGKS